MKRFRRATAIILSLALFAGVTTFVGAKQNSSDFSQTFKTFTEIFNR